MLMQDDLIRDAEHFELKAWGADKPFPLTEAQCCAVLKGHAVRWSADIDDVARLPGRFELIEGWLILKR
jgi:hypothetical protein